MDYGPTVWEAPLRSGGREGHSPPQTPFASYTHCAFTASKGKAGKWIHHPESRSPHFLRDTLDLGTDKHRESPDAGSWGSAHALELLLLHNDRAVASQVHGAWRSHVVGGTGCM